MAILLNDETMQSKWCVEEWHTARDAGIPIICIVDADKWHARELIKSYVQAGQIGFPLTINNVVTARS